MAINEAVNIGINVDGTASVKDAANAYEDLGDAVAKTQLEAERLANTYGINDQRTQEAIKVAGKYKQQMEELDFAIDGARGGVDQMFRATQGIVAGFEVAAGAAALFGGENEELEKTLMKVQGAMVFAQGLKDLKEFAPAIISAATALKTQLITAFSTMKGAIAATGIGALIVSLGILIGKVSEYNEEIDKTIDKERELFKVRNKEGIDAIDEAIKKAEKKLEKDLLIAKAQGKSEEELRKIELKRLEDRKMKLLELSGSEKLSFEVQSKAREEYRKLDEIITKKELENQIAVNAARKQSVEQSKVIAKERQETEQKRLDDEFEAWQAQELANYEYRQQLAAEEEKRREEEFQIWEAQELANYEYRVKLAEEDARKKKELEDQDIANQKAKAELEQQLFDQSRALADAVIGIVGEQSAIGKALALAQIGADTATALSGALSNSQSKTPDNIATGGLAGIGKFIAIAATILSNAKRAYSIIKSPAPGGTSGGVGGGAARGSVGGGGVPTFQAPRVQLGVGGEQFTQANRVYVTEADISNTQNKVKVTEGISSF